LLGGMIAKQADNLFQTQLYDHAPNLQSGDIYAMSHLGEPHN